MVFACETHYDAEKRVWSGAPVEIEKTPPIGDVLLDNLLARGEKVMQIFDGGDFVEPLTASELYRRSIKLAVQFRLHGIRPGDVVTFHVQHLTNSTPMVIALFAVGAVLNTLDRNNLCKPAVGRSFLQLVKPKYIICHTDMVAEVLAHAEQVSCTAELITFEENDGQYASVEGLLRNAANDSESDFMYTEIKDTERTPALILASSGTTGLPKAICLSHALLFDQIARCTINKDVGIMFNPSPIDWISGYDNFIGSMYRGKTRIICRLPITADRFVQIIERHQVTDTFCDPSRMYELDRVLQTQGKTLTSVQLLACSGTLASEQLQLKILDCFPMAGVAVGYGLTEIGGLATASLMGQRGFSVGFILRGIHMRLQDSQGQALGPEEVGELYVRCSHSFMSGANGEMSDLQVSDRDTWLSTDDIGYFDKDGFLFIVGRKGDQLKYTHHVIRPIDIESVLEQHESIRRAAVVGVSVPIYNDMPAAVCVRSGDGDNVNAEELQNWLKDKLPDTHQLRGGIYFVDELPMTSTGKVRKVICKELAFRLYHEQKVAI